MARSGGWLRWPAAPLISEYAADVYLTTEMVNEVVARYGQPLIYALTFEIQPDGLATVRGSRKNDRAHDITLFIFQDSRLALIQKHTHPPDAFRAPSGGVNPGESIEDGARREAYEETGLRIELERYLVRIDALFTCGPEREPWTTHIFVAHAVAGELGTHDPREIRDLRWGTITQLQGPIRQVMLSTGRGLLAYRVALTDVAVARLRELGYPAD
ncbi:MAG: NUDIX hydrolase [Chloroflexi bacterium]|nr:NUDIX hydrolase [Chloroflexota bacterium]